MQMDQAVNQYRELYDFAPVPLLCLSAQGAITRLNFAAARSLAQERARLMGLDLSRFVHPTYTARLALMLQTSNTSSDSCRDELMLVVPNHPPQFWLASVTGKGDGTFSLALFDITQQQQEMETLRRQAEGWRKAVDVAGVGTWDWHIPSGQFSHSPCFANLLEFRGDHHGLTVDFWRERVHPDDWPLVLASIQNHLSGKSAAVVLSFRISKSAGGWQRVTLRGAVTEREADASAVRMMGTLVSAD
jgi:PAS domain-containing protein